MPILTLSDEVISALQAPPGRPHAEFFDTDTPGFYVDVLATGRKSYRLRRRVEGRLKVTTLGDARALPLQQARQAALALLGEDQVQAQLFSPAAGPAGGVMSAPPGAAWGQVVPGASGLAWTGASAGSVTTATLAHAGLYPAVMHAAPLPPSMTVGEFFTEHYLPYVKSYKRSWGTDLSMINNHILPRLGHRAMGELIPPDLAKFVEQMKAEDYAPGTCNRALVLLRYGYTLAVRWRLTGIAHNPLLEVKNLRDDNKIERFLSEEQLARLVHCVKHSDNPMLYYIVVFLLYTGARKREVLDARWEDVDWGQKSWRIPKTKSGKIRHVPLSSGALQLLAYLQGLNDMLPEEQRSAHVFCNPRTGLPFVSFFYSWDTARKQAGLPDLRVHDLRHSFASFLVNAGRSLYEVQELLGHADIRTTSRYAHLSRERLREAVEVVPLGEQAFEL